VPFTGTRLDFLPASAPRARPAGDHLLSSKAMASFLREAGQLYDIVIVDLPPALPIGGVLALSPALDGLVLAIEADKTQMDLIVTLSDHFSRARAKVFGFAITKAAKPARA
jgi:succinoglycan biosynthesis transport protein ExoP